MIIGIVGSRRMSPYGKLVVSKLVNSLLVKQHRIITGRVRGVNNWVIECGKEKVEVVETQDFEMMNKIIADKCDKLVVIEGGENSGTFLVAQAVRELGKEVWAVPGRITDETSVAPNWLIKTGAKILADLTDIL